MSIKISCIGIIILGLSVVFNVKAQTQLSADEFASKLPDSQQVQLIDVRTPAEYQDGHLKNSKNLDYKSANFKEEIQDLDKTKPVFVYCLSGGRSALASKALIENGFSEVYELKGGYLKWASSGKKVEGSEGKSVKGMNMADFNKLTASNSVVLVDFYAKWCAPCIKMLPTVTKLKAEYQGKAKIETIDYDANKGLAKELGIDEIPAFLLYKDGKLITRKNGMMEEKDFRNLLESSL
jgi:thioredoxin 1